MASFILAGVCALLAVGEGISRWSETTDYPLFRLDPHIGYIEQPDQSGSLGRVNDWAYNDKSMGIAAPFRPSPTAPDTLLVGDSIVNGGNLYRERDKLGARLGQRLGAVWPVGAGNWSLGNESAYLDRHPRFSPASIGSSSC
ncbi:hypothetical protein Q4F19_04905 [Sphingomonas sp. BIUV-7]|uniref:Uncharacterized protein n=1 Tax=Sphingomonas natans TaxID=3063330 RepID=A0ABT8Y5W6_9SPHN|nr:hypothetical protein [Sphingomonas sp. BIUV-7]